jgi:hypothetical protein
MTNERSWRGLLHRATHRIPGVPAHAERSARHQGAAAGHQSTVARHQGTVDHGGARHHGGIAAHASPKQRWNHSPGRPARFMPAWQRRIAAFFGREL